ncbi:hypothetical protein QE152_g40302 [Popillia japonica]|uniref:Uncharacterized protein n=1 Tax=Popillia japonica TaxID=7064 RepID=A0AAW1HRL0_POPJA
MYARQHGRKLEGQQNKLRDLLQKFEEHFIGKENVAYERYKFFTYRQEEGESLEDFIIELKKKASRCKLEGLQDSFKLEGLQDSLIVTMITCGIRNEAIRQRLLENDTLTLEKAVELCQVIESAKIRSQAMEQGSTRKAEIDIVHKKTGHNSTKHIIKNCSKCAAKVRSQAMGQGSTRKAEIDIVHKKTGHNSTKNIIKNCSKCGKKEHDINKCPAFGKICHYCKIQNHFATVCFKKKKATTSEKNKKITEVKEAVVDNNTDSFYSFLYVGSVTDKNVISNNDQWWTHLEINNQIVRLKIDTGAMVNILPIKTFKSLGLSENVLCKSNILPIKTFKSLGLSENVLCKSNMNIHSYTGDRLKVLGNSSIECMRNNNCIIRY